MLHAHDLKPAAHAIVAVVAAFDAAMVRALLEVVFNDGPLRETARDCGVPRSTLADRARKLREALAGYVELVRAEDRDPLPLLVHGVGVEGVEGAEGLETVLEPRHADEGAQAPAQTPAELAGSTG